MANILPRIKRGTGAALTTDNGTYLDGELVYDRTANKLKMHDGATAYNSLPYIGGDGGGIFEPNVWRVELLEANTAQANADLLNAAITAAAPVNGVVIVPAGQFLSRTIVWDKRVHLKGMGSKHTRITGTAAEPLIQCTDPTFYPINSRIEGMQLRGGVDDANRLNTHAIEIVQISHFHFRDIIMNYFTDYAMRLTGVLIGKFEMCWMLLSQGGVKADTVTTPVFNKSNLVVFDCCQWSDINDFAVNWVDAGHISFNNGCDFERCGTSGNLSTGVIKMANIASDGEGVGMVMDNAWFESNFGIVFNIQGSANTRHSIRNTMCEYGTTSKAVSLNGGRLLIDNSTVSFPIDIVSGYLESRNSVLGTVALTGTSTHKKNDAVNATGTTWNLGSVVGTTYNYGAASSATAYAFINKVEGGYARGLVNAPSKPTVTSGTEISGATFVANTDMEMVMEVVNGVVLYYFLTR